MENNWLADLFIKQREIIEAAETPFAKLAVFVLPILAPSVPAVMTGLHLYKLFLEMFDFSQAETLSFILSATISLVLELLGYVGAISFIKSLFNWIKTRREEYLVPFALNGIAYLFYLISMWLINVQLGRYFGTSDIVNNIVGLLSFITVPTSLLAANHLNEVSEEEQEEKIRQEQRQDKMEKYRIKHGVPATSRSNMEVPKDFQNSYGSNSKMGRPSVHQERVFSYLEEGFQNSGTIPSFTEVVRDLGLSQSTASRIRKEWLEKNRSKNEEKL